MVEESINQQLLNKSLASPQTESNEEREQQVSIIKGLSTENDLMKIELRLRGYRYDFFKRQLIQSRQPIMNDYGIGNFMASMQALGDLANFSNYDEKEIPKLVVLFFEDNYPDFVVYADEFELNQKDMNVIKSILKFYALSVLKNAKNAGHRNVVRGTLSESVLNKALGRDDQQQKKKGGLFSFLRRNKDGN